MTAIAPLSVKPIATLLTMCLLIGSSHVQAQNALETSSLPVNCEPRRDAQIELSPDKARAKSSFALELLAELAQNSADPIVQVSPFGATQVLLALDYGADPKMRKAIAKTLGASARQGLEAMRADARLIGVLSRDKTSRFASADALFVDKSLKLKPGLDERLQAETSTEMHSLDFGQPASVSTVNEWARSKTRGKILATLKEGETPSLIAVNAFSFADCWKYPFDPARTEKVQFKGADGKQSLIEAMNSGEIGVPFVQKDDWFSVELPYADERFAMTLISNAKAPITEKSIKGALGILALESERTPVLVQLPKFKAQDSHELLDSVSKLGLGAHRQLRGFSDEIVLSSIRQKTLIVVDEQGTQAAAITAGLATRTVAQPPLRLSFTQPFIYLLRHKATGSILLAGLYRHPSGDEQ